MKSNFSIHIISINDISFNIPLYKYIINFFQHYSANQINIIHSKINSIKDFSDNINSKPILVFKNTNEFYNQRLITKLIKHLKFQLFMIRIISKKGSHIIYSPDFEAIISVLVYKFLFRKHKLLIVYHQFELVESDSLSYPKKGLLKLFYKIAPSIDLVLIPEINRLNYFHKHTGINKDSILLFPNTCSSSVINNKYLYDSNEHENNYKTIAHVGALSTKNFFLKEYLESIAKSNLKNIRLLFVGRVTDEAKLLINSYDLISTKIVDFIQHDELLELYHTIDIGVILYKSISLNSEFAAPNKLYEFWSKGIPVIAPKLKGLVPLFKHEFLGYTIDFSNSQVLSLDIDDLLKDQEQLHTQIKKYFDENLAIDNYLTQLERKLDQKVKLIQNG